MEDKITEVKQQMQNRVNQLLGADPIYNRLLGQLDILSESADTQEADDGTDDSPEDSE